MSQVKPIPDGYPRLAPYLIVDGAADAIKFYVEVLGATERVRMPGPNGRIGHAELNFGDSVVMLADEPPGGEARGPKSHGGSPVSLHLYVERVDAVVEQAARRGATIVRPVADQFYGDRLGVITDPWGHTWSVATHVEDISPEEMHRRGVEAMKKMREQG